MDCCSSIVKTFLFITNFLIFLLSCAVIGLGIWILVDKPSLVNILDTTETSIPIYDSAVILLIVVASLALIITFLGCCGAWKESRCMLGTYFVAVLALLVLIVVGTVIGMSQGVEHIAEPLKDTMYLYDETSQRADIQEITKLWDDVQVQYQCCGVFSAEDWSKTPRFNGDGYMEDGTAIIMGVRVPRSCCEAATDKAKCMTRPTNRNGAYVVGCFELLYDDISDHINIVGGIAIAIIVIMVLDMAIACYMCTCTLSQDTDVIGRPRKRNYNKPPGNYP